jgi:hypothetical protein
VCVWWNTIAFSLDRSYLPSDAKLAQDLGNALPHGHLGLLQGVLQGSDLKLQLGDAAVFVLRGLVRVVHSRLQRETHAHTSTRRWVGSPMSTAVQGKVAHTHAAGHMKLSLTSTTYKGIEDSPR